MGLADQDTRLHIKGSPYKVATRLEFPQLRCCAAACSRLLRTTEASLVLRTYLLPRTSAVLESFVAGDHGYEQEYQNQP